MSDLKAASSSTQISASSGTDDAFSQLYKMSTTSAGGQEYVAINSASIAALLLGTASVLALVHGALLIVPVAGVACALIAFAQIRGSNGTQTGRGFAAIGLALALVIGLARIGMAAKDWSDARSDTRHVVPIFDRLSQEIHAARYTEAYEDLFSSAFRRRIDRQAFTAAFQQLSDRADYGPLASITWNDERVEYLDVGTSGVRMGYAMGIFKFQRYPSPIRQMVTFSTRDGSWRIDNIDFLFPQTKAAADAGN
jgi:hypothetical protein